MDSLARRQHIQHADAASQLEPHWGYANRILPCTNDHGTCEYLDGVYWMHDTSMLYTFVMWAVIGFLLISAVGIRFVKPSGKQVCTGSLEDQKNGSASSAAFRLWRGALASMRKRLLPEGCVKFFGHVTRLQLLVLFILSAYLIVFSLVGIVYKTWITPVKGNATLHNTRTGLGGFSDRVGALAYALTPLTVALGSRESILSLATGIPYQSFNFLHRWSGRIIFFQGVLHTFGWCLIEARLYVPQPTVWKNFIKQLYMIWGVVALMFITFLYVFSLRSVIRLTGYEFFRKTHYVVAMLYIGACWGHWNRLACWMIASLGIWGIDRGVRLLRTILIHYGYANGSTGRGFHPAQSSVQYFDDEDGGVIRLEFDHKHDSWAVGQHFFLNFPALTIWQSHPLTVASLPTSPSEVPHHTYIVRCRKGETARLKSLALGQTQSLRSASTEIKPGDHVTTPVILCGPYGTALLPRTGTPETTNVLAIAGGTGVSIILPVVLAATSSPAFEKAAVDFFWIIRRTSNTQWIAAELQELKSRSTLENTNLNLHIFVTQEEDASASNPSLPHVSVLDNKTTAGIEIKPFSLPSSSSSEKAPSSIANFNITYLNSAHPSLHDIVSIFMEKRARTQFRTRVIASGPANMGEDLRTVVAKCNNGGKVRKGDMRWDVDLTWDDRGD